MAVQKDESNFGANHFEFSVLKKNGPETIFIRIGILFLALLIAVGGTIILSDVMGDLALYVLILWYFVGLILAMFLWKFTNVEYEYIFDSGEMTMIAIYSRKFHKTLFKKRIVEMDVIRPFDGKKPEFDSAEKKYTCISSPKDFAPVMGSVVYLIAFKDAEGKSVAALFEAPKKSETILKFYNSSATKVSNQ